MAQQQGTLDNVLETIKLELGRPGDLGQESGQLSNLTTRAPFRHEHCLVMDPPAVPWTKILRASHVLYTHDGLRRARFCGQIGKVLSI